MREINAVVPRATLAAAGPLLAGVGVSLAALSHHGISAVGHGGISAALLSSQVALVWINRRRLLDESYPTALIRIVVLTLFSMTLMVTGLYAAGIVIFLAWVVFTSTTWVELTPLISGLQAIDWLLGVARRAPRQGRAVVAVR